MAKKVTFNGIELSLSKYNGASEALFDYLDEVVTHLEKGLDKTDENFKLSINVDFKADKPPRHRIYANGSTSKKTRNKVARILKKNGVKDYSHVTGSVKVNLKVDDEPLVG